MSAIKTAKFITSGEDYGSVCPVFRKTLKFGKAVASASMSVTALGLYEARVNGARVGEYVLAPGWTAYDKRLQYQTYDITPFITGDDTVEICVGPGWAVGPIGWGNNTQRWSPYVAAACSIEVTYADGTGETIITDESWQSAKSAILMSEIYNGEEYDSRAIPSGWVPVNILERDMDTLIPQEGEEIREQETVAAVKLLTTPEGDTVIDFGQNLTGYVEFKVTGPSGHTAEINHAEVLDADGNFYTKNLRAAKQTVTLVCNGGEVAFKPHFTFQGFRYIRLKNWPEEVKLGNFTAIAVYSAMKRTGRFECSNKKLNRLHENVVWGQRSNFVDVPTDCPQRDERLGWTGDAQVFCKTAAYVYDVEKFFTKWLRDMTANQYENGGIPAVIPDIMPGDGCSAAWGDASTVCPWEIYLAYGNKKILEDQFETMRRWVEYIRAQGENEFLWNTGHHYGDWCALDVPEGQAVGATDIFLIATAMYAYSTSILIKVGKALGRDMSEYERLYRNIVAEFRKTFIDENDLPKCETQTACILTAYFRLSQNPEKAAAKLAKMIRENGNKLKTGFVGTAYLMQALTENGFADVAYDLILQEEFPSWLYSVNMGATTIWEHWDGMKPDGTMWSSGMNSFNHYAYGAVASWMYGVMAGINPDPDAPGYENIIFKPVTNGKIDWVKASLETKRGRIEASWKRDNGKTYYRFTVPSGATAKVILGSQTYNVQAGTHEYTV